MNFGNIMVSDPQASARLRVWAIDTAANLPELEAKIMQRVTQTGDFDKNTRSSLGLLKKLFDRGPQDVAARLADGLSKHMIGVQSRQVMQAPTGAEQMDLIKDSPRVQKLASYLADNLRAVRPEMMGFITEGYNEGVSRLMNLMSAANKSGPDRQADKAEADTQDSWETLKAHTRYMQLRSAHGLDHTMAAEYVKRYAHYRVLKATNIPTPTAADPTRFADLAFPSIILKERPLIAKAETKQNLKQDQYRAAAKFYSDIKVFTTELDTQISDLNKIESPAGFSPSVMKVEIKADVTKQKTPGQQRGVVAPADVEDLKRKSLLVKYIGDLYKTSLAILAYGEVYQVKGDSSVPSRLKMKDGSLTEYGPKLSIQIGAIFKQMETIKTPHRRLEVHAT